MALPFSDYMEWRQPDMRFNGEPDIKPGYSTSPVIVFCKQERKQELVWLHHWAQVALIGVCLACPRGKMRITTWDIGQAP